MTKDRNFIFLLIFAMVLWGLSWPTAKIVTTYASEYTLLFWRFLLTTLGTIPLMWYFKQPFSFSKKGLKYIALGTFFIFTYNIFFFLGLRYGLSGLGGVLVTTLNPILTFFIVALISRKSFSPIQMIGLLLAIIGGSLIIRVWEVDAHTLMQGGNLFFLIASLLWAFLTLSSSGGKAHVPVLTFSFYLYLGTTIISFVMADKGEIYQSLFFDMTFWINMFFISVIVTSIATTIYFKASTVLGSAIASSFIFLVPATAIVGSFLILGEIPRISTIIGGIICISAVGLINKNSVKLTTN